MARGVKLECYKVANLGCDFGRFVTEAVLADSYGDFGSLHEAGECSSSGENGLFAEQHGGGGGGEMYLI